MTWALDRWRARRRLRRTVGIWYHEGYAIPALARTARSLGVEPRRGERILGALFAERLLRPADVHAPGPSSLEEAVVSFQDLARVHTPAYIDSTTEAQTLAHVFGLEPDLIDVEEVLTAQRRAVLGTVEAAAAVAAGRYRVTFNVGGGFHHAEPDRGGGFCVYNDVAVAIARLRSEGERRRIAIVDLDYHQGNGNIAVFAADESVLTFSIQGAIWSRATAVADVQITLPARTGDETYLAALREALPAALRAHAAELVFYIAGNDVLAGDALGAFELSARGVLARDRFVCEAAGALGAGLVITLAGGYSAGAWGASAALLRFLLTGEERVQPLRARPSPEELYPRLGRRLDPIDLQRESDDLFRLDERELVADLGHHVPARRLLDYYTRQGVEYALERYGYLDAIRAKGFHDLRVAVDPRDRSRQIVRVHGRKGLGPPLLLVEVVLQRLSLPIPFAPDASPSVPLLSVEWLLLQDPTAHFSLERPPLPGQEHPGLGLAAETLELLLQVCRRLDLEGLQNAPAHYHMAYVGAKRFRFLDPELQGRFLALCAALRGFDLAEATRLVEERKLLLADRTPIPWVPGVYIFPLSPRLVAYFESDRYRELAETARDRLLGAGLHAVAPASEIR